MEPRQETQEQGSCDVCLLVPSGEMETLTSVRSQSKLRAVQFGGELLADRVSSDGGCFFSRIVTSQTHISSRTPDAPWQLGYPIYPHTWPLEQYKNVRMTGYATYDPVDVHRFERKSSPIATSPGQDTYIVKQAKSRDANCARRYVRAYLVPTNRLYPL